MRIYFSGIGGVGIGPLAEIAHDAGYEVLGSDPAHSLMTEQLASRGIEIYDNQDGTFLKTVHRQSPIDWFVYTAALPADHPELVMAAKLGIRTAKRDELLAHIIAEKDLKLIAISGTHGKTTTTGMMVWTLLELGIPVSYSVGSTLSFGPSGAFDSESEYFVYECDEFDRNLLHFSPHLTLITSLGFDHSDTYDSAEDYQAAFATFIDQSEHTIGWQRDLNKIVSGANAWQLSEDEVADIALPGHNKRNATLVAKACEYLQLDDPSRILEAFPGTDRRFEKLADNLYSDYGHHPDEIASTLAMARELSERVVLVYQPHQNIRQHEVKHLYTDCFDLAEKVYWLPTYLSREDPALAALSPEELTEDVANKDVLAYAQLDETLWENIQSHRTTGALVLCMGAGSIDAWVRQQL